MKKTLFIALTLGLVAAAGVACSKVGEEEINPAEPAKVSYSASIDTPVLGTFDGEALPTKALTWSDTDSKLKFAFTSSEKITIVPEDLQGNFPHFQLDPDTVNAAKAYFDTPHVILSDGTWYAVYPDSTVTAEGKVTFDFANQVQDGANSTAHLAKYDFNLAKLTLAGSQGNFALQHQVSWLRIEIYNDKKDAKTFASDIWFTNGGTFDDKGKLKTPNVLNNKLTYDVKGENSTIASGEDGIKLSIGSISVPEKSSVYAYLTVPSGTYNDIILYTTKTKPDGAVELKSLYQLKKQATLTAGIYYNVQIKVE